MVQKNPTLYDLTEEALNLQEILEQLESDPTAETAQLVDAVLEAQTENQEALQAKLDGYCSLIRYLEHWAKIRKEEADRLAKLADADTKTVRFLKERLRQYLDTIGESRIRTPRFNITLAANGGKQPIRLTCDSVFALPPKYQRVTVEANLDAIRDAIAAGEEVPYVQIVERGSHVRIR